MAGWPIVRGWAVMGGCAVVGRRGPAGWWAGGGSRFFGFIKTAKPWKIRSLIGSAGEFADLAKLLSDKDIPIVFKLLKNNARKTFAWYISERAP
jgi:hypothetical protein